MVKRGARSTPDVLLRDMISSTHEWQLSLGRGSDSCCAGLTPGSVDSWWGGRKRRAMQNIFVATTASDQGVNQYAPVANSRRGSRR
jgi:hypothetical protein